MIATPKANKPQDIVLRLVASVPLLIQLPHQDVRALGEVKYPLYQNQKPAV
jgi:hypothetical protein